MHLQNPHQMGPLHTELASPTTQSAHGDTRHSTRSMHTHAAGEPLDAFMRYLPGETEGVGLLQSQWVSIFTLLTKLGPAMRA